MTLEWNPDHTHNVFADVLDERSRQVEKWGPQHHPDGTRAVLFIQQQAYYKARNDHQAMHGNVLWSDILLEEVYEALSEDDPVKLREELIQSAAVIVAWVEDLDSRSEGDSGRS